MAITPQAWMEIAFDLAYLVTIWSLVVVMVRRQRLLRPNERHLTKLIIAAFALLGLGDTGHVGLRVLAYRTGELQTDTTNTLGLVGFGALATAITVTFFYMLMLFVWQARFAQPLGWTSVVLLGAATLRLIIMAFPENQWSNSIPPQPWSLYRNLPLIIQGLGVAALILRDARRQRDPTFFWIGTLILVSYAFYLPVILFVQLVPALGVLMIPKTLAYVAIAVIALKRLFPKPLRLVAQLQP